jgi:hypothetical protein
MTLNVKDCETSSPDGSSKSVSNLGSSINTPSRRTVITTHTSGTSSTGTAIADSLETPLLTPRTSVASSNTKQNEETPSTTSFTPQVSMTSSFATQTSLPSIQSENVPIPSTESPASSPLGSQDVATPRTLPVPIPYYGGPDTFKEVNRSPPDREHYAFHFGESREASPFTFRKMHNATPEPPRMTDHSTSGFGPVELSGGPISKNSTQMPTSGSFKATSTSTLGPSVELEQVPGSRHVLQGSNLSKYDVKDERPPNEPYFNEHFQKALQKGKYIAGNIKKTLQTCELADDRDSHVYRMIQTADELHNFDAPTVCTIGIVGDSGVGKIRRYLLSLLNC